MSRDCAEESLPNLSLLTIADDSLGIIAPRSCPHEIDNGLKASNRFALTRSNRSELLNFRELILELASPLVRRHLVVRLNLSVGYRQYCRSLAVRFMRLN